MWLTECTINTTSFNSVTDKSLLAITGSNIGITLSLVVVLVKFILPLLQASDGFINIELTLSMNSLSGGSTP